ARARMDADGAVGNAGRRGQCRCAHLLRAGCLDHGTDHLRGWGCLVDESRGPSRDTTGLRRTLARRPAKRACRAASPRSDKLDLVVCFRYATTGPREGAAGAKMRLSAQE